MRHSPLPRILDALPSILVQPLFVLIDAIGRTQGVCLFGVQSVITHADGGVAASPLAMVLIGTLVGAGGDVCVSSLVPGLTASFLPMFNGFSSNWSLRQPPWARGQLAVDLWSCSVRAPASPR